MCGVQPGESKTTWNFKGWESDRLTFKKAYLWNVCLKGIMRVWRSNTSFYHKKRNIVEMTNYRGVNSANSARNMSVQSICRLNDGYDRSQPLANTLFLQTWKTSFHGKSGCLFCKSLRNCQKCCHEQHDLKEGIWSAGIRREAFDRQVVLNRLILSSVGVAVDRHSLSSFQNADQARLRHRFT